MAEQFPELELSTETDYAQGRLPTRTYITKSFIASFGNDSGHPHRYVYKVFDETSSDQGDDGLEWEAFVIDETPVQRKQLQLQIARSRGAVRQIRVQKVPAPGSSAELKTILKLNREQSARFLELVRAVEHIDAEGEKSVRIDDSLLQEVLANPDAIATLYRQSPTGFRELIESDVHADDVVALGRRREVVARMRSWLDDPAAFSQAASEAGGPEKAWQKLLEANPWVLGVGLGAHIFTSWREGQLEHTVVGRSIAGVGKRADALLKTAGLVQSLVFAEIKHHDVDLLTKDHYRVGCYGASKDLAGAVVQAQQTVHLASRDIHDYLQDESKEGEKLPSGTFLLQPRSYLVIGSLKEMLGEGGGPLTDRYRSFELFRRNMRSPEVLTFDELVAGAEQHLLLAANPDPT